MDAFHGFRVDRDGVRELLNSEGFRDAVQVAADQVGAAARGAGHRVTSGEPLPVEVFDRVVEKFGTTHWQQVTPARYIYTSQEFGVSSVFQETKGIALGAYFGELVFAETSAAMTTYRQGLTGSSGYPRS